MTGHVQLDSVVYDLSRKFGANGPDQPLDCGSLEFLHRAASDAQIVVMMMTNSGDAEHMRSVHRDKLADCPRLDKDVDGAIYRRPTDRRQFFAQRLDCEAVVLLLQEIDYRFSGESDPIAEVLEHGCQVRG